MPQKRVSKKFAILQHGMLVLFKNEHENEADEFVDLRKVQDVIWAQGSTEIEIVTETNRMHFAATDSPSARQWVTSIRQFWRDTVNPLTEYPKSFMYNSGPAFGLISLSALMSATESIAKEDVERVAVMHALHEIYSNPYFICVPFRCQKAFPAVSVSDYFAVIFAKKICKLFMASELSSCKSTEDGDEDFYVIDQIKTAVSRLIDQSIIKEMLAFDE
jgi:hypothetical protein